MNKRKSFQVKVTAGALIISVLLTILLAQGIDVGWLESWILCSSLTTFGLYGIDKSLAKMDRFRVPESCLLTLGLAGGGLGGLIGMNVFRHKTRKTVFWVSNTSGLILAVVALWFVRF